MTPDVDALITTVREALEDYDKWQPEFRLAPEALAALDSLAAELERRLTVEYGVKLSEGAEAAEAELEKVKAAWKECEQQVGQERATAYNFRDTAMSTQARLNRALTALREIVELPLPSPGSGTYKDALRIARAAIAEIEGADFEWKPQEC